MKGRLALSGQQGDEARDDAEAGAADVRHEGRAGERADDQRGIGSQVEDHELRLSAGSRKAMTPGAKNLTRGCRDQALAARRLRGLDPVQRLKAREKAAGSENPTR